MNEEELDTKSSQIFQSSIEEHFGKLEDYRRAGSTKYTLGDILFITICAVISGANTLKSVAEYAQHKKQWLADILRLEDDVPSYSTFWTIFALLNPDSLGKCFIEWVKSGIEQKTGRIVNIDGKAQRGTATKGKSSSFVHIVSAWSAENHLTLGQLKVDGKSNEITAIPKLLDMIDVKDAVVTIDAMGCQREIAAKIIEKGGDYVLALKGNQGNLADEVENYFRQGNAVDFEDLDCRAVGEKEAHHGRIEKREVYVTEDIEWLPGKEDWTGLKSIIMVKSEREEKGKVSREIRFYITSLEANASKVSRIVRKHWSIENQAHWILDVGFREDEQNANARNIAENLSLMRRAALNLLKQDKSKKVGIEIKCSSQYLI